MFALYKRYRTVLLAIVMAASFVAAAIFSFDVDPKLMGQYFLLSIGSVLMLVFAAFLCILMWKTLAKLRKPR